MTLATTIIELTSAEERHTYAHLRTTMKQIHEAESLLQAWKCP